MTTRRLARYALALAAGLLIGVLGIACLAAEPGSTLRTVLVWAAVVGALVVAWMAFLPVVDRQAQRGRRR